MNNVIVEIVAPFDVNRALKTPEKYITGETDVALVKVYDPEEPHNPATILVGVDREGYYLCAKDNNLCVHHTCDDDFPTLRELYANLLEWVEGRHENPPQRVKTIEYTVRPDAIKTGFDNLDAFIINEEEPVELLRIHDSLHPENPVIFYAEEDEGDFMITVQDSKHFFCSKGTASQTLFEVFMEAVRQVLSQA